MTCSDLGGPCALPHRGTDANEIITGQDAHLREAAAGGDETHTAALEAMKGRWKNPVGDMKWYRTVKKDFAAIPVA